LTERTGGQRPTLEAVARRAGASRSAVSRVVNGEPGVRAAVAERIREAVAELGYVPNQAARKLAGQRNNAVAVVVTDPQERLFVDPFFAQNLRGIRQELVERGAQLVLLFIEEPDDYARVGDFLGGGHVDGALLFSLRADDPLPAMMDRLGLPAVFNGRPVSGPGERSSHGDPHGHAHGCPHRYLYVDADNRGGARLAAEHFVRTGRRRPVMITGQRDTRVAVAREQGFTEGLMLAGVPLLGVEAGDFTEEGGTAAMERLLANHPAPDAVFAASDAMAIGALRTLRAHGLRVPEDVAVVGFNDLASARHTNPPLTTVHQPVRALGQEMARMLVGAIEGHDPSPLILPTRLTVRESAPSAAGPA